MGSYIYTQTNETNVSEYSKEVRETSEEFVISYQFNKTIDTNDVDKKALNTIEKDGLVESATKL